MRQIIRSTIFLIMMFSGLSAQLTTLDWKIHTVGKVRQVITNNGALNAADQFRDKYGYPYLINCEYPPNSNEEHLYVSGIWIGAITEDGDTLVSMTREHDQPDEFYATAAEWDTVWVVNKSDTVDIPYWPGYVGVSDQDFVCRYNDYTILTVENHKPMYLDVIQRSHAWSSPPLDEFIVLRYDVIPTQKNLKNVYISYWQQGEVGMNSVGDNWIDELTSFFPEEHMAMTIDGEGGNDGDAISPIAIKILNPTDTANVLNWGYHWYEHSDLAKISRDRQRYIKMSDGVTMDNLVEPQRSHFSIDFGPFPELQVGDTLHFELALVLGNGMANVQKNAEYLEFLTKKEFRVPSPPPKPQFKVTTKNKSVHFNWIPPDDKHNPELYQDPYRSDGEKQPFEGYRLYKSTKSINGPWTLLAEFDVPNNNVGFNTGIQYEYEDQGLLNNFDYFYTLTAFSKPDAVTHFPSQETSLSDNAILAVPSTAPPAKLGKVEVVPNPYRGDIAYHQFDPPWEKVPGGRRWMEQDRRVQFIHLPMDCEIKIYSLAGDLVETISHYSTTEGYENWNLTSSIGQAVASGIYLFSVEDQTNGDIQVGKFVVIK